MRLGGRCRGPFVLRTGCFCGGLCCVQLSCLVLSCLVVAFYCYVWLSCCRVDSVVWIRSVDFVECNILIVSVVCTITVPRIWDTVII